MHPRRACSNQSNDARLFYFAATVPTVGFVWPMAQVELWEKAATASEQSELHLIHYIAKWPAPGLDDTHLS
jgi:hypothetical protein